MRIGVDIGGTFTDLVAVDNGGTIHSAKALSTPADPSIGVVDGLRLLAHGMATDAAGLLAGTEILIHGTTYSTNLLLEEKGARLGLVTTAGFGDLLELREGLKTHRYDMRSPSVPPLVPRSLRREVAERVLWDGTVETSLDEDAVERELKGLRDAGVEALVVCFLHAHRRPEHERRVREIAHGMDWHPYISLSHEVLSREGEYDRLSTTVINAYVGPGLATYLGWLEQRLTDLGGRVPILVMQSNGGVLPVDEASQFAVGTLLSGPAGGAAAAALYGRLSRIPLLATCDMGGTSSDISVVRDGTPLERQALEKDHLKIVLPAIDISSLAIGGGSIARLNPGGLLQVGPDSAGADPGPVCFGRGGTQPTLTDANLVLGYLPTARDEGGMLRLAVEPARQAIDRHLGQPLGLSTEEAALAVTALANSLLAEGIRAVTLKKGLDPRDLAIFSFGGAGGLHADALARELGVPRAVIPLDAPVLSALGFLATDVRHDEHVHFGDPIDGIIMDRLCASFRDLEQKGRSRLTGEGFADEDIGAQRTASCRYLRQVHSVEVPIEEEELLRPDIGWLAEKFEDRYRVLFFHTQEGEEIIVESIRVTSLGRLPRLNLPKHDLGESDAAPALSGARRAYFGKWSEVPVYSFEALRFGMTFAGPALVDSRFTTIMVQPGSRVELDELGTLCIANGEAA